MECKTMLKYPFTTYGRLISNINTFNHQKVVFEVIWMNWKLSLDGLGEGSIKASEYAAAIGPFSLAFIPIYMGLRKIQKLVYE